MTKNRSKTQNASAIRLQKWLSQAGVASRRTAEKWIADGRVTVNQRIAQLGQRVDPDCDHVAVDGRLVGHRPPSQVWLLYKPAGCVTTAFDPQGRKTVMSFVQHLNVRLFPVGRLDYQTQGLLLLTNDGALAHALMHPSKKVAKTYRVKVRGGVTPLTLQKLCKGVQLEDGMTAPAKTRLVKSARDISVFDLTLHEGKNRQVRRMCDAVGHPVLALTRTKLGSLTLAGLRPGQMRQLTATEIERLRGQPADKCV